MGDIAIDSPDERNADPCTSSGCMWQKYSDGKVYVPYVIANHYCKAFLIFILATHVCSISVCGLKHLQFLKWDFIIIWATQFSPDSGY